MVNNPEFGLLHNASYAQRIQPHSGPPTPDDLDELLSRRRSTRLIKAAISYLVSAYFSVAVLVPDALGMLENVEISRPFS